MMNKLQQARLVRELEDRFSPQIAQAFLDVIQTQADAINIADLVRAIEANDLLRVEALLGFDSGRLFPLSEAIRQAFVAGGMSVTQSSGLGGVFGFDGRHTRALGLIDTQTGTLIQGIQRDTLQMARDVIRRGIDDGMSGQRIARMITGTQNRVTGRREGGFLGLNSQQTDWAISARQELGTLNENYFSRKLRNRNFDAMVRRAIDSGKPLSQADVDRIANAYKDRLLKYRGEIIARTESHTATAMGRYEGYVQLQESGIADVTKRWVHGFSREARASHVAAASAPSRPIDAPFMGEGGLPMQYPHDPSGGAENSINCRCSLYYRVKRR